MRCCRVSQKINFICE